jgi:hypothetical protein
MDRSAAERELWDVMANQQPFDDESAEYLEAEIRRLKAIIGDADRIAAVIAAANDHQS